MSQHHTSRNRKGGDTALDLFASDSIMVAIQLRTVARLTLVDRRGASGSCRGAVLVVDVLLWRWLGRGSWSWSRSGFGHRCLCRLLILLGLLS